MTRLAAASVVALLAAWPLAGCRSDAPVVREVPLVRDMLPQPPFPEGWRVVDASQPIGPATPYAPHERQFPFERIDLAPAERGAFRTGGFTAMEHTGTYLAAPRTRADTGATVDSFGSTDLLLPLSIVDVPAGQSTSFAVTDAAVRAQERAHGRIPRGSAVFLRTGLAAGATPPHTGWTAAAVDWLVKERGVRVVGSDVQLIDVSRATKGPAQAAAAAHGIWTVGGLRRLDEVPYRGAYVTIGALPIEGGAGSPARVVVLVPPRTATPADAAPVP